MGETIQQERAAMLAMVHEGSFSVEGLENWAANRRKQGHDCPPFSTAPNEGATDPMHLEQWTLPMAAAWFIWRSVAAVRDQSVAGRMGWKVWRQIEPKQSASGYPKCRLVDIYPPYFWDVISQARLIPTTKARASRNALLPVASNSRDLPYERIKTALLDGELVGTSSAGGEKIRPEQWRRFLYLIEKNKSREAAGEIPQCTFSKENVIGAETRIAARDYDSPVWDLAQAIGWIAYQDRRTVRGLTEIDLRGKSYHGQRYKLDSAINDPERHLLGALVEGRLKGYLNGTELTVAERLALRSAWANPDVTFFRNQVLLAWPEKMPESHTSVKPTKAAEPATTALKKTGPKTNKRADGTKAMLRAIEENEITPADFRKLSGKALQERFNLKRDTARDARADALRQLDGINSNK
jgi:hypothetical protein